MFQHQASLKGKTYKGINAGFFYNLRAIFWGINFYKKAIRDIEILPSMKVLDIGCGTGNLLINISRIHSPQIVVGCDPSIEQITYACKKKSHFNSNILFILASMNELCFKDTVFDLVFSSLAIHVVDDTFYDSIMCGIKKILKTNGLFIFIDFKWLPKTFYRAEWNFINMVHCIEDYGFKCIDRNQISRCIDRAIFIN